MRNTPEQPEKRTVARLGSSVGSPTKLAIVGLTFEPLILPRPRQLRPDGDAAIAAIAAELLAKGRSLNGHGLAVFGFPQAAQRNHIPRVGGSSLPPPATIVQNFVCRRNGNLTAVGGHLGLKPFPRPTEFWEGSGATRFGDHYLCRRGPP
jgi:hypothetical protein